MGEDERQNDASDAEEQHDNSMGGAAWLKPYGFKPGESGNPGGRPKGRTLLSRVLEIISDDIEGEEAARAFVDQLKKGVFTHHKEIFERQEGKVADKMDMNANIRDPDAAVRGIELVDAIIRANVTKKHGTGQVDQPPEVPAGDL